MKTTLDHISAAMEMADGRTPREVVDAFIPDPVETFSGRLIQLTAGHYLALAKLDHPFVNRASEWDSGQLAIAMFCFTRRSSDLFCLLESGEFEAELFKFLDALPAAEIEKAANQVFAHWKAAFSTAIPMASPNPAAQKKTADSDGCSQPSPTPPRHFLGRWITRLTKYLWPSFSR